MKSKVLCWTTFKKWLNRNLARLPLSQVRVAVLNCRHTPDELTREAMTQFKMSYSYALRVLQARKELQAAGHPAFQTTGHYVELAPSPKPDAMLDQLKQLQSSLEQWNEHMTATLAEEPRLRLLDPRSRLKALLACKRWLFPDEVSPDEDEDEDDAADAVDSLAVILEAYIMQAFPEALRYRVKSLELLETACADAAKQLISKPIRNDDEQAMELLVCSIQCFGTALAVLPELKSVEVGPRKGDVENGTVCVVDTSENEAQSGVTDMAYDAHLNCITAALETEGITPAQVFH
jgi:hypothetical protein